MPKIIALDAGHAKTTNGKEGPDGRKEWTYNDRVLRAVDKHLHAEWTAFQVVRLDDPLGERDVPLIERTNRANAVGADLLVSIHHNALRGRWGDHGGTETYVNTPMADNPKSEALARMIHPRVVRALGLHDRGVKDGNLHMLRESRMPAVLIEGGFMDSRRDVLVLRDDERMNEQGRAIASGIAAFLRLPKKMKRPSEVAKTDGLYRLKIDGSKVGAYASDRNLLREVEQAIRARKSSIELERV